MKKVFVSHPYQGKKANKETIGHLCQWLEKKGVMPISPVHLFGWKNDHNPEERAQALRYCREVLKMCDEVYIFGDWQNSEGCKMEYRTAQEYLITVRIVEGWKAGEPVFREV